jgi:23S rRNA (cytidine1920-2'-O)/16S rRNA (cytidine1409-2'-O)-methyltransferase
MVKPQFEAGRERVGKGGVVRDQATRIETLVTVAESARDGGASVMGFAPSGLPGPSGNRETFVWLAEAGRPGAVADVEAAARAVDP